MSAFDKIIGYEPEKRELRKLCGMMRNWEAYEKLGAKPSKGLLISGAPGLGKSLMAKCLLKESGRRSYILRRNKPGNDFINEIHETFQDAAEHAPSIILLDDMDKFVVEEDSCEEYVVLQAAIDEVAGKDVYVVATINSIRDIPDSLVRAGRFDRTLKVLLPNQKESEQIIAHYLSGKPLSSSVDPLDVAKMVSGKSCAEMESILNEAALYAGGNGSAHIEMEHIVEAFLSLEHSIKDTSMTMKEDKARRIAYHEAGHVVVQDLISQGGVGLVTILNSFRKGSGGFMIHCRDGRQDDYEPILVSLGGLAAEELAFGHYCTGGGRDLGRAKGLLWQYLAEEGTLGLSSLDVTGNSRFDPSPALMSRIEIMVASELERYQRQVRTMLTENQPFLDAVAKELLEKHYLLNSDIQRIRESCMIDQIGYSKAG